VDDQEERSRLRRREHRPELVLEQQAEDSGRNRPDHEQPTELRVGVVRANLPVAEAPSEPLQDAPPVPPEESEQDERGRQMRRDEKRDEERVVLMDVPTEQLRED